MLTGVTSPTAPVESTRTGTKVTLSGDRGTTVGLTLAERRPDALSTSRV